MVRTLGSVIFALLLSVSLMAQDLSTVAKIRARSYGLLSMDTTGTDNLPESTMSVYARFGIAQTNEDYNCYRVLTLCTLNAGEKFEPLDSVVKLINCHWISGDSTVYINIIPAESSNQVSNVFNGEPAEDYPNYVYQHSDSLRFLPTPRQQFIFYVEYVHLIPDDSIRFIQPQYRRHVLFNTVNLAKQDLGLVK